jgi:hypothetical protein
VVRRAVREEVSVLAATVVPGLPVVAFVVRGSREHVAEHLVQPPAHPIGKLVHPSILHRCHDGSMGLTEKAKELADATLEKAGKLSETAREKAPDVIDKAADATVKAIDAATSGIDRVTRGRFHEKLDGAAAKMEGGLDRPRSGEPTTPAGAGEEPGQTTPSSAPPPVAPPSPTPTETPTSTPPVTPATTNADATDPDTSKP